MTALRRALLIAFGALLGGLFREVLTEFLPVVAEDPALIAPALLVVNVSGSLLAGFIRRLTLDEERKGRDTAWIEATMVVGFCGGYTSYSAFVSVLHEGLAGSEPWAIGLAAATIVLCPLAAAIGLRASGGYPPRPAVRRPEADGGTESARP
jgi:fluoride ion exporter CrcB/FEX